MNRPRVLLADDHRMVAEGLRSLLAAEFELVGVVEDGRAMIAAARNLRPDVIVADIAMPHLNGIEAVARLKKDNRDIKVVMLTMHPNASYARRALDAGASGFVVKHSAPAELVMAIHAALKGKTFITPALAGESVAGNSAPTAACDCRLIDPAPAGNFATVGGGPLGEGNSQNASDLGPNGRVSQIPDDGGARSPQRPRTHPLRHQEWDCDDLGTLVVVSGTFLFPK